MVVSHFFFSSFWHNVARSQNWKENSCSCRRNSNHFATCRAPCKSCFVDLFWHMNEKAGDPDLRPKSKYLWEAVGAIIVKRFGISIGQPFDLSVLQLWRWANERAEFYITSRLASATLAKNFDRFLQLVSNKSKYSYPIDTIAPQSLCRTAHRDVSSTTNPNTRQESWEIFQTCWKLEPRSQPGKAGWENKMQRKLFQASFLSVKFNSQRQSKTRPHIVQKRQGKLRERSSCESK